MSKPPEPWQRESKKNAWYAQVNGKQRRLAGPEATKTEARAILNRMLAGQGEPEAVKKMTLVDLGDQFLGHVEAHCRPATFAWYKNYIQAWVNHSPKTAISQLKVLHVTSWLAAHPTWGPSTRRGAMTVAKRMLAWAEEQGYVAASPYAGRKLKRPKMGVRKGISSDEAKRLLDAIKTPRIKDYVLAMMLTGARPGEIASAEAKKMAPDGKSIKLKGKTGERIVYLSPQASEIFARLAVKYPEGPLFRTKQGNPWNSNASRCVFRRLRKSTGIAHATPYACRHLFGTEGIRRGVDSVLMAELMGHKTTAMLMEHYLHTEKETLKDAVDRATRQEASDT